MFLRVEFSDMNQVENVSKNTCLSSKDAYELVNIPIKKSLVTFWHVDIDILNKECHGVLKALNKIQESPGVKSVDILPIMRDPHGLQEDEYYDLVHYISTFANGV